MFDNLNGHSFEYIIIISVGENPFFLILFMYIYYINLYILISLANILYANIKTE